eukprot:2662666-Amphidinium_carterae.1
MRHKVDVARMSHQLRVSTSQAACVEITHMTLLSTNHVEDCDVSLRRDGHARMLEQAASAHEIATGCP